MPVRTVRLSYGNDSLFEAKSTATALSPSTRCTAAELSIQEQLLAALRRPLDFPSVEQAVIPGDRVTVALDRHTPGAAGIVAGIWEVLAPRGIEADKFTVIQPASRMESQIAGSPRRTSRLTSASQVPLDSARPVSTRKTLCLSGLDRLG